MRRALSCFEAMLSMWLMVTAFVCTPAWSLDPATVMARYTRQTWSTDNGLPQNSVHAMIQTSDGYLWLGTEGGLARFDGYQFRVFDRESTPQLPANDIRCLLEDRSGGLWIGTASGLARLKNGVMQNFAGRDGIGLDAVRSMLETADGTLWVLTVNGLTEAPIEGTSAEQVNFHTVSGRDGLLSESVHAIAAASGGGIWVGTAKGLNRVTPTRVERGPEDAIGISVNALANGRGDTVFFDSPRGLMQLASGVATLLAKPELLPVGGVVRLLDTGEGVWAVGKNSITLVRPKGILTFAAGRSLPGTQIETIFEDRQGTVWIGTNGGVARWRNGRMENISVGGAPTAAAVLSILEDREGDVWIGTETSGVVELRNSTFDILGTAQGLPEEATTSVVQTAKGDLWVGTNGGGLSRIGGAGVRTYTSKDGLASDIVLALANGRGDPTDLWIGTPDGLNLLRNGHYTVYTSAHGLADDLIRSLLVTQDNGLWVGTRHGVTRWKDGHATTLTTADGMGSDLVGAMFEDAAGDLWVGTLGGLSRIHAGAIRNYTIADGLPSNTITALEGGADGSLWIGTNGQGLALFDGAHFFSFAAAPALPHDIYAILEDGLGSLWISSGQGIYRIALAELGTFRAGRKGEVAVVHYGTGDGLGPLEGADAGHPSAWRMLDGRLCFATRRGIVVVDPSRLPRNDLAPSVVLEEITVDDRSVTAEQLSSIAPGVSHLSFSFAGISLAAPQRVQYRYMLEGFDRDWVNAGARRIAFYTNIPHGRYRFRVSARNAGGPWSGPGAEVLLVLLPHFYQTVSFRIVLGVLLAAASFGLYRLRLLTLQSRFNAVVAERSRIAREIHDTLAQGFVAVSTRLEIMSQMLRAGGLEDCREQLDHTRGLVRESLAEARRSIWNLRSDGAESRTLPARLARSIEQVASTGTNARLETTGVYRPLEQSTEDELCRIGEEAVTNAVRHAGASRIRLCLAYAEDRLLLEVVDDGCGFDILSVPTGEDGHFGLTGMRERARVIGTDVILVSKPGQGTTVRVEVPMSQGRKSRERGSK